MQSLLHSSCQVKGVEAPLTAISNVYMYPRYAIKRVMRSLHLRIPY